MRLNATAREMGYLKEALVREHWAGASDVLRLVALWEFGGIYLDMDVEICDAFALAAMEHDAFKKGLFTAGWEDEHGLCGAVMIAPPRHPFVEAMLARYAALRFDDTFNGRENGTTLLAKEAARWRTSKYVQLVPPPVFYPWHWRDKDFSHEAKRHAITCCGSVTAHHWEGSWVK
jgi:mannosyltransferase OCH1-like enzyme